jgi:8-amino-3,8-dideoxy-alpha-D-manno-octulosonate transaminase
MALAAFGVGDGDEVLMPTFTFVASFEAVMHTGAIPVPVDVDDTLSMDPNAAREAVSDATRVLMPVHMCGEMANMDALKAMAEEKGIFLLEDACQAFGAEAKGKKAGTWGDIAVLSFDFVKTITCGEGGAVLSNQEAYQDFFHQYADHGHDHIGTDRGAENHPIIGFNFRITELQAAVGIAQLRKIDAILKRQRTNKTIIRSYIDGIQGVTVRRLNYPGEGENWSFLTLFFPDEETTHQVNLELKKASVPGCFYWYVNNWHYIRQWHHFKELRFPFRRSERYKKRFFEVVQRAFSQSDAYMSRAISFAIGLYDDEEAKRRGERIAEIITQVFRAGA